VHLVITGDHPFDDVDRLESDICALLRARDEEFYGADQLREWLDEAEIPYDARSLALAIAHLYATGRLKRPRADLWEGDGEPPTRFVEPRVFDESAQAYY
jgi:hypothetical protein